MMIFFRATKAPVFFDLARWTSLKIVLEPDNTALNGYSHCYLPKGTLAELAQNLIVGDF